MHAAPSDNPSTPPRDGEAAAAASARAFLREAEGVDFARERIRTRNGRQQPMKSRIRDLLPLTFDARRINRSEAYSRDGFTPTWRKAISRACAG